MVLRPEPLFAAVDWIRARYPSESERVILLSPQGSRLGHAVAKRLAGFERLVLLCGRYEGVDERVREALADEEVSIGDVVKHPVLPDAASRMEILQVQDRGVKVVKLLPPVGKSAPPALQTSSEQASSIG